MKQHHKKILAGYLPETAVDPVVRLIEKHRVYLTISRKRKTKHGDFRPPLNGLPARISVNHNLNPYAFLITFLHELAHQLVWFKHHNRVKPHGTEWQQAFTRLLDPFLSEKYFPRNILDVLTDRDKKIFASTSSDTSLAKILKTYDRQNPFHLLENLGENGIFSLPDGRRFQKLKKRRKNYLCLCLDNKRHYVFNPLAEVIPMEFPAK